MQHDTYSDRHQRSEQAEAKFKRVARATELTLYPMGAEHHYPRPVCRRLIALGGHDSIRYMPDFLGTTKTGDWIWIEVKASHHLERRAYEHDQQLDHRQPVWIVADVGDPGSLRVARASQITFKQCDWQPPTSSSGTWYRTIDWDHTPYRLLPVPPLHRIPRNLEI